MSVTAAQVQRVGAGAGTTAACQVIADAINTGTGVVATVSAPLVLTGSALSVRAATNAVSGSASAAQITALEGLQAGTASVQTITAASGAVNLTAGVTFLNPSATGTYTLAAGANGQRKLIQLCATQSVTVSGIGAGWTGGTAGDWVEAVYSTVLAAWTIIGQYVD